MSQWELTTLDKLGKISSGKSYCRKYEFNPKLHEESISFVGVKEVGQSRLHILKCNRYYFLNKLSLMNNKLFSKNTVCISIYGSYPGDAALLKNDSFLSNCVFAFSSYKNISNPQFIKYCLELSEKTFSSISATTIIKKALPIYKLLSVKFPCPPHDIQQKIGDILSAYDELIENSEQQIEVLQNIRTSIFKEWFINLRFPDSNLVAYWPERRFPSDWRYQKLEEVAKIEVGKESANNAVKNGRYPFFTNSTKDKLARTNKYSYDTSATLINFGGSDFRARFYRGKFEASDFSYIVLSKDKNLIFLIFEAIMFILPQIYKCSVNYKKLKKQQLEGIKIIIPDSKTLEKFNSICENIQLKIESLSIGIEKLERMKKDLHKMIFSQKIEIF
ncbi:restriction endonuclease subunit S [Mycoplasma parvum]|uniref:Type I restriction modification DNA specificity domain-containing protein n=1 Tax=Mycoplasma parvum str. Indiana TaxID=1403316 RepID=U5NFB1_9MOLU|nr:restriction endonuclease subunit S [Mycoplasma parvum]AGX88898.1 hypothetical protein PRV_00660 [Mycoplasma parvum str. Indiana]